MKKKKNAIYITCICVIHTVDLTFFDINMFILHNFCRNFLIEQNEWEIFI